MEGPLAAFLGVFGGPESVSEQPRWVSWLLLMRFEARSGYAFLVYSASLECTSKRMPVFTFFGVISSAWRYGAYGFSEEQPVWSN